MCAKKKKKKENTFLRFGGLTFACYIVKLQSSTQADWPVLSEPVKCGRLQGIAWRSLDEHLVWLMDLNNLHSWQKNHNQSTDYRIRPLKIT